MGFWPRFFDFMTFFFFFVLKKPIPNGKKSWELPIHGDKIKILIRKCSEDSVLVNPIANGVIDVGLERST